jgi:hypothetical protein
LWNHMFPGETIEAAREEREKKATICVLVVNAALSRAPYSVDYVNLQNARVSAPQTFPTRS